MQDPLAELAGYFCRGTEVPDRELIRLAAAARAGGSRWDGIAAACGVRDYRDITGVLTLPCWNGSDTGADLLFSAAQHAVHAGDRQPRRVRPDVLAVPGLRAAGHRPRPRRPPGPYRARPRAPAARGWPATRPPTTRPAGTGCRG